MFVKVNTNGSVNQFPYTIGQLRRDNNNISFPKIIPNSLLETFNVFPVELEDISDYDRRTQYIENSEIPELVDNQWVLKKIICDKTSEEINNYDKVVENQVRVKRNKLLSDTDWTQLPDAPTENAQEWQTYRQSLRDIPQQSNFPTDVDWPSKPD